MKITSYIASILSLLLLGAHFMREGDNGLMVASIALIPLLFYNKRWTLYIISFCLIIGSLEWVLTAIQFYEIRQMMGMPAGRMLAIILGVAVFTLFSGIIILNSKFLSKHKPSKNDWGIVASFIITVVLIWIAQAKVTFPILLLERFAPSWGKLQIIALGLYSSFIAEKLSDYSRSAKWRRIIWTLFSVVFFLQLILGLLGIEKLLMTGNLHLPVPAMIMAGPIFRWEISIMIFLFLGSILFLGPGWCSFLCYFGVWDDWASRSKKRPKQLPSYRQYLRIGIALFVIIGAIALNVLDSSPAVAAIMGGIFGIGGVIYIITWSRKKGVMTHCTTYCPIGIFAVALGKISPFRISIDNNCTECAHCHVACRYDALNMKDIKNRKPNINCTLCGDCIGVCEVSSIKYRFLKMKPQNARILFMSLAASLHTVFLGLGRL